MFTTELVHEHA